MIECRECVRWLRGFRETSVDHCIMDPPYGTYTHSNQRSGAGKRVSKERDLDFSSLTPELRAQVANELGRVVRRWVLVFSDHEGSHLWARDLSNAGLSYVRTGIWRKRGAPPQFTGDRPATGHECIVIAHGSVKNDRGRMWWNGGGKHGVWEFPIVRGKSRTHTAQKPLSLMMALVEDFTDPGDLVIDPFAGAGTTVLAAFIAGRKGVGCEIDPNYAQAANARIAAYEKQLVESCAIPRSPEPGAGGA